MIQVTDEIVLRKYVAQLLEALKYLHEQDMVHGNVKVENVYVSKANKILLADFSETHKQPDRLRRTAVRG